MKSAGIKALTESAAKRVLARARETAPVDTGAYRDGLTLEHKETAHRTVVRVVGHDKKTILVESKTGNLARAMSAAKGGA
uniref:Type I neck protein n=1 Tax=Siphoviridae sp. ctvGX2 TaxID=2826512 RepID=A0A8S5LZE1_9CAUD|nr:MAG TPA: type I neck protein [Siphoviridae sp. ctvGX2]